MSTNSLRQEQVIKRSCETEFGITSLSRTQTSSVELLKYRRQHWFIETGLHYRRDVTYKEDATRRTKAAVGRIVATIHHLVIALIKELAIPMRPKPGVGLLDTLTKLSPCCSLPTRDFEKAMYYSCLNLFLTQN